jgi:ribA/ribD-fused uncharacterized protein
VDLEQLREAVGRGERFKYLFFWGHTPKGSARLGPWVFSQWWPSPFEVEGAHYPTAEHWMMARKAELFGDTGALADVLAAGHPGEAKKIGRRVRDFDPAVWGAKCFQIVVDGNVAKFGSDPELREYLLGTRDRVLVEASPRDRIWGIGMGKNNPAAEDPRQWRGKNLLGFALMEARARLRRGE